MHDDGTATYADFGPAKQGSPFGVGQINVLPNLRKVTFDQFGVPTKASFEALTKAMPQFKRQNPKTVKMAFFKTSAADTIALDGWIQQQRKNGLSKNPQYYLFYANNCADFCERGKLAARAPVGLTPISAIPNLRTPPTTRVRNRSRP